MERNKNYLLILSVGMILLLASFTMGQTCLNFASTISSAQENFNTLASVGTSSTYPSGFAATDSVPDVVYAADNGTTNAGDIYSYGASAAADRALGAKADGTTGTITLGGCFTNNSGGSFGSISILYTGEQWRSGTATADALVFEYSTNATGIADGAATWTTFSALNFNAPVNTGVGQLDGNNAANQATVNATIAVVVNNMSSFYFRWREVNSIGSDHGMAVDDFFMTALAPTAADGTITGRARTASGSGIKFAVLMLSGGELDEPIYATTNGFGNYIFQDVPVGQTYVLQITSGRHTFLNSSRLIDLGDNLTDIDFIVDDGGASDRKNDTKDRVVVRGTTKNRQ